MNYVFLLVIIVALLIALIAIWWNARVEARQLRERLAKAEDALANKEAQERQMRLEIAEAKNAVARLHAQAEEVVEKAKQKSYELHNESMRGSAAIIEQAKMHSRELIADAEAKAKQIAGDALTAKHGAERWERVSAAMRNIVEGYGDQYLIPNHTVLDGIADNFGFTEAGSEYKAAREKVATMIKYGQAGMCDYVENNRRETAIRFVIDAFNGKVDSIMTNVKSGNFGTLKQKIEDAYAQVNHLGAPFRSARITDEFLGARLVELKWAVAVMLLKEKELEEQRRIREQLREEERARKEYERAQKEALKEEENLRKAIEKANQQLGKANEEQKAKYEAQLAELNEKLKAAEQKNQRATSMAQLTRSGHIYIISNIGSFGENIYKIGMTRRLEPMDRVKELGDASVPFSFDVHAMIYTDDAPTLEKELHKRFVISQVNKVNPRKEFFRLNLIDIRKLVESMNLLVSWTMTAAALEYRESMMLERELTGNQTTREAWIKNQLSWDPMLETEEESAT